MTDNEWTATDHAERYLDRADEFPHRGEGEAVMRELIAPGARRILDLGTGDGRQIVLLRAAHPECEFVGLDVSDAMLAGARERFADDPRVALQTQDLNDPLPALGTFDAVVSCFAIHHLEDDRKRSLYGEVPALLRPGGVFCNLEHVASPTPRLHAAFLDALGYTAEEEDDSNRLLDPWTQLAWLREHGLDDVECYWKWREMALLAGVRPG